MEKKLLKETLLPVITVDFAFMLVISAIAFWKNITGGFICLGITVALRIFHMYFSEKSALKNYGEVVKRVEEDGEEMSKAFANGSPLLLCVTSADGTLLWANDDFDKMFPTQESFDKEAGAALVNKFFDNPETIEDILIDDKYYSVSGKQLSRSDGTIAIMLFWQNVTARETVKQLYADSKVCMATIEIDNYDEIISSAPAEEQSTISAALDVAIRSWAAEYDAGLLKYRSSRYLMVFDNKSLESMRTSGFKLLNIMHDIETKADFPTSVSVGICVGESTLSALLETAVEARDFAQARGGDQVVIRHKGGRTEFFGGALPTVEKRNKGKSRVVAHSLARLINAADTVLVMGHSNPDLDAFGSCAGIFSLARNMGKPAGIVLDSPSEGILEAYNAALKAEEYSFVSGEFALEHITENTLLVVVDCHKAVMTECPKLAEKATRIAVLDHHRKADNAIEGAVLTHHEVYASSASELITEILQYSGSNGEISKFTAEMLLSGIILDTKSFSVNTGVRTFEAASWLRRQGADNSVIRNYFKVSLDFFRKKSNIISSCEILSNGVAVAYTKESDPAMQILVAQVADELLDMKGVEASFVAGRSGERTTISARSAGKVNVQVIMEKLGGGGHQNVAAAQVETGPEEAIANTVKIMREENIL